MPRTANAQFIGSLQAKLPTRLNGDDDADKKIFSFPVADTAF
jgi:hypothetical protein